MAEGEAVARSWILTAASLAKRSTRRAGKRTPRQRSRSAIEVIWENPRGRNQGVIIRRREGGYIIERRVGPSQFFSTAEAAEVLGTYRMKLYRLPAGCGVRTPRGGGVWGG